MIINNFDKNTADVTASLQKIFSDYAIKFSSILFNRKIEDK